MFSLMKRLKFLTGFVRQRSVLIAIITLNVIFLSSVGVHYFEQQAADSNIHSVWDGIWWAVVTVATVGYGDRFPISVGGRIVGFVLMFFGVGMMSLLTATIASIFVEKKIMEDKGLETVKVKDHLIICGWNQHTEEVLAGLTTYGLTGDAPIVLINELSVDEIESFRLKYKKFNLKFLRGDYVREDVLLRANIAGARVAVIMADVSGGHSRERTDERTALTALTIKYLAPQVKTIAELLDGENRQHLKRANVEEIIVRGEHIGSLLATAVKSPGLPRLISGMLSLGDTNKFWRVEIPKTFIGRTFQDLSTHYREKQHAILIGFLKDKKAMKLEDLLSDNTSVIDKFIREKIRETKKDFYYEKDEARIVVNPADDYTISPDDYAVVLSKSMPK
ncbi:MAG: ion channel [Syntrophales bacterium]|nr:ion channel [Syntrophales bacterium]MDP3098510.1 ion channel [Syntrophales bacterium]